jgi:TRAP-type C4-dicarboxylate transport system permease small subunit
MFARTLQKINSVLYPIVKWVNYIGLAALAAMMFLTASDVSLRKLFNAPILGSYEIQGFLMVILVAFAVGYTVASHLSKKSQVAVEMVTNFVCFLLYALICWRLYYHATTTFASGATSGALSIPEYPFVYVAAVGFTVLSLVFLVQFLECLARLVKWTQ